MLVKEWTDFNDAENLIESSFRSAWKDLRTFLTRMPLHVKASDQRGLQDTLIFDPKGANRYFKQRLQPQPIPSKYKFMGKHVDHAKGGMIVEVQFSNYPFLLNNVVRSDLFFKSHVRLADEPVRILVVIVKAKMFPPSQSTLYYEQAKDQLSALAKIGTFTIPVRLVGLFEKVDTDTKAVYTNYREARYSRTPVTEREVVCHVCSGRTAQGRCLLQIVE